MNCPVCGSLLKQGQSLACSRTCNGKIQGKLNARPVEDRLWPRLYEDANGCWQWCGGKDQDGYGALSWVRSNGKREQRAHRIAWILVLGEIPDGRQVLHKCDNPSCCNPMPLFIGTSADNNRDMKMKGRSKGPRGELSGHAKLTQKKVVEIRQRWAEGKTTQRQLARDFGVGYKAIHKIVHRQRWCHI